jgi:acyl-CoA thioester hydrolase
MTDRPPNANWSDLAGRISGGRHVLPVRVYYEDTDAGGVVYHANYLKYCERARTDWLRLLGIRQSEMPDLFFVVRRMTCDFLRPAKLDDLLEIETGFVEMRGARLELAQQVMREGHSLFAASVTVALIDGQGRPKRLPKDVAALLSTLSDQQS